MQKSTKKCVTCGELKPVSCFYKRSASKDGISYKCKHCDLSAQKKYKSSGKSISNHRKYKYGLTDEEFLATLSKQNNECAICGIELDFKSGTRKHHIGKLNIDHCHTTGKVRGFLCMKCNAGLGMFNDDFKTVYRAYKYLSKHEGKKC